MDTVVSKCDQMGVVQVRQTTFCAFLTCFCWKIVAFFVSYSYVDTIVSKWDQMGVLQVSKSQICGCYLHLRVLLLVYCPTWTSLYHDGTKWGFDRRE